MSPMGGLGIKDNSVIQQRAMQRMKIIRGHIDRVYKMIDEGQYCIDVINQSKAVQSALREVDYLLMENHLQTCVVDLVKKGETQRSVKEIMWVFKNHKQ